MANHDRDGARDFDFWFGRWKVRNRRLKERLVGARDWEEFDAVVECHPVLGGLGNVDSFDTDWGGGFRGMSLRLFDPAAKRWSIWWASDRTGRLEPPVSGAFEAGVGRFHGRDRHGDTPVLVRFVWSDVSATGAKWEQAFSIDEGRSWETNWVMHMTRIGTA